MSKAFMGCHKQGSVHFCHTYICFKASIVLQVISDDVKLLHKQCYLPDTFFSNYLLKGEKCICSIVYLLKRIGHELLMGWDIELKTDLSWLCCFCREQAGQIEFNNQYVNLKHASHTVNMQNCTHTATPHSKLNHDQRKHMYIAGN